MQGSGSGRAVVLRFDESGLALKAATRVASDIFDMDAAKVSSAR